MCHLFRYRALLSLGLLFGFTQLQAASEGAATPVPDAGSVPIKLGEDVVGFYQAQPMEHPLGGEKFRGSNFIHPLKTPSGFTITDFQPCDHLHHFGLWWPWKHVQLGDRQILFWELQGGDGIINATGVEHTDDGLLATADYLDRKHSDGAKVILRETTRIQTSAAEDAPASGYFLEMEISHRVVGDERLIVTPYRYSGFSIRATHVWHKDNSTIATSHGKERYTANASKARWVLVKGDTDTGGNAGFLMMAHPDNQSHVESIRTWDKWHNGAVFVNFNPVMENPWVFEPGNDYVRKYSFYIFDGEISVEDAEVLWKQYVEANG